MHWILMAMAMAIACATTRASEARVESALDLLADTVDPAYSFAADACATAERAERDAELAGRQAESDTDRRLRAIRQRCDAIVAAFERVRSAHSQAVAAYHAGAWERAERLIEQARAGWHELGRMAR